MTVSIAALFCKFWFLSPSFHWQANLHWKSGWQSIQIPNILDSGIDVAPGINVAPGIFGKNNKRSPSNRYPPYNKIAKILKKNMHYPLLKGA